MKKRVMLAVILAGALCVPTVVSADTGVTKIGTLGYSQWIYNTNLLKVEGSTGYGVQTVDGTAVTESVYSGMDSKYGYIILDEYEEGYAYKGVIDKSGKQLLPFDYADIKILNQNWILGINIEDATADVYDYESWTEDNTYYKIAKVDVYSVVDGTATCVTSLTRENFMDAKAVGPYINIEDRATGIVTSYDAAFTQVATDIYIYDSPVENLEYEIFMENDLKGIKDASGNVILAPTFEYIYDFNHGHAEVELNDKTGLVDEKGNIVVPAEFEDVDTVYTGAYNEEEDSCSVYNAFGYYTVVRDGKVGYVKEGQVVFEPKYSEDVFESNGVSGTVVDLTGNTILVAADGVETVLEGYDRIYPMEGSCGMFYEVSNADGMEGVIDWHGKEVLPCTYGQVSMSYDGNYILASVDYQTYELYQVSTGMTAETNAASEEVATETEVEAAGEEVATETTEEVAADSAVEEVSSEFSGVLTLIDSAKSILANDSMENRTAAAAVLESAAALLGEEQAAVAVLINSAAEQLKAEGTDLNVVLTLIDSAVVML